MSSAVELNGYLRRVEGEFALARLLARVVLGINLAIILAVFAERVTLSLGPLRFELESIDIWVRAVSPILGLLFFGSCVWGAWRMANLYLRVPIVLESATDHSRPLSIMGGHVVYRKDIEIDGEFGKKTENIKATISTLLISGILALSISNAFLKEIVFLIQDRPVSLWSFLMGILNAVAYVGMILLWLNIAGATAFKLRAYHEKIFADRSESGTLR